MLNDRSKFFTINIKNINALIDTLSEDNKYSVNHKDLLALLYILKDLEYETNLITINNLHKKYIKEKIGMSESTYNHFITKMRKLDIFADKQKNDVYTVNKEYINFGTNEYESGDYIKVSSRNLERDLEKCNCSFSATDIKIFLHLLNDIRYNKGFAANAIVIEKDDREKIIEKFGITYRTLDNFMKKAKDTGLLIKVNNSIYKVNDRYFVFGGKINTATEKKESKIEKPDGAQSSKIKRDWLFKKGDGKNE